MSENQPIQESSQGMEKPLPPLPPPSQPVELKTSLVGDSAEHLNQHKNEE
jgi:hypothetical protein